MSEPKYYSPTIDEFFIGFEYEFSDGDSSFEKASIKDGTQIDDITRTHNGKSVYKIRVKYLDKEDIESLGFVEAEKEDGEPELQFDIISRIDDAYRLSYNMEDKTLTISTWIRSKIFERKGAFFGIKYHGSKTETVRKTIFHGTVKNKSEFKMLLQQLGI